MAQNVGTLVSAAIRPNDSLDLIASAFASEIKGGLHTTQTTSDRDSIIIERRDWGMMCYVVNQDKTYQLKYGVSSNNLMDNLNWVEFSGSGGGGGGGSSTEWIDSVFSVQYSQPVSPSNGDRYLVGLNPASVITGASWSSYSPGFVAQWNSSLGWWDLLTPTEGMTVTVDNEDNAIYRYEGTYPSGGWQRERLQQIRNITATTVDGQNFTSTSTPNFTTYTEDVIFLVDFSTANTASPLYLNINGKGNVIVKKPTSSGLSDINSSEIIPGVIYSLTYDGTYFQSVKPFSESDALAIKYYIGPSETVLVPQYYQYWIYGDLTVAGQLINYGHVIIANGNLVLTGTFSNLGGGQIAFVNFNSGGTSSIALNDSSTIDFLSTNLISGLSASAVIKHDSITASLLDTSNNGGATAGYILSNSGDGKFKWIQSAGLEVSDFLTGTTYSGVTSLIFRGGVLSTPTGTATGVYAEGPAPQVTVWIPAPNYVGYFSPTLGSGPYSRYISNPTTNGYTSSVNNGHFGTGNWVPSNDFTSSTTRNVTNSSGSLSAFTETEFACYDNGTTMSFTLYNHDGTILTDITNYVISGVGSTTSNGLTITVNSFLPDNDRYKANVSGSISVGTLFPNGGRFNWNVTHYNNGNGPGNVSAGVYSFSQSTPVFYDNDGSSSSANIQTGVDFNELTPSLVYYSGVAFYDTSSTFAVTASGVNLLNDITIPTTKQIDFSFTNLAVTGTLDGHTDGSKGVGNVITGWSLDWNKSGLTYSRTATVNSSSQYIPGFSTNNSISTSPSSYVTSRIYDYGLVGSSQSVSRLMLFDTYNPGSVTYNNNPLDSESGRLSTTGVITNGSTTFSSTSTLASDELQYIFGRVIYPQTNFTTFYPLINSSSSVNYSSLTGANKSFTVYTDINVGTTTTVNFNGYRWHVTSYGKDASYSTSFTNGIFTLNSNFTESVLDYDGVNSTSGSGDLVILVGLDSSGSNTTPDRFLYVSGDPVTYGTRQNPVTYNLDNVTESSKNIQWSKGTLPEVVRKVWLFVGYKNSVTGKNLRMTNIALS